MNDRIEIVSPTELRIVRNTYNLIPSGVSLEAGDVCIEQPRDGGRARWDAEGRAALLDALHCLADSGSFAALADTSPVPYTGKRMRDDGGNEITLVFPSFNVWLLTDGSSITTDRIRPLRPAPRVRPYTKEEAVQHIGRWLRRKDGGEWIVNYVGEEACIASGTCFRYGEMLTLTWADTGEPCGALESD